MSTGYFLRTVPRVPDELPLEEKLRIAVHNSGNYFYEESLSRHLRSVTTIRGLSDVNEADATLVLSMSNFISPSTDLGFFADEIEAARIGRIVMVGAGAQAYDYDDGITLTPGTRRFVDLLSERSRSIGVRGVFTADILERMGVHNVEVIGCPSMFYHCRPDFEVVSKTLPTEPAVAVNCTPLGYYRDKVSALLAYGVRHAAAYVAQSESELVGMTSADGERSSQADFFVHYYCDHSVTPDRLFSWLSRQSHWFFDLNRWFSFMQTMDFSVGSRFHGNMAAILAGTPALNLVFDTRTRELCEYLNLPYRQLKDLPVDCRTEDLYEAANFELFNRTYPQKFDRYRRFLVDAGIDVTLPGPAMERTAPAAPARRAVEMLMQDMLGLDACPEGLATEVDLRLSATRSAAERREVDF